MKPAEYTFRFSDFKDVHSNVHIIEHHTGKCQELTVAVDETRFLPPLTRQLPSLYADLIDLAIAIYIVDRFAISRHDLPRRLNVFIPIRHPELFKQQSVMGKLRDVLHWYTEDVWEFTFLSRCAIGRSAEIQTCFPLNNDIGVIEVALWSGGLDSLAGLVNRIASHTADQYVLFGSGSNSLIHNRQRELTIRLAPYHRQELMCVQVLYPYVASHLPRNRNQRVRGFVFMMLGTVCALLLGQDHIYIYENGIGAINLPFRASELGLDHTRAVHPISLIEMGELISQIVNSHFHCVNPFVFWTKAEMCIVLKGENYHSVIEDTISCDRLHRKHPNQCGCCSSCLLRKQALLAAKVQDNTKYLFPLSDSEQPYRPSIGNHLRAMLWQNRILRQIFLTDSPWYSFVRHYPSLMDIVDRTSILENVMPELMQNQLVQLYQRYLHEWEQVQPMIGQGLLGIEELREVA